jgi:hypothetical protein
MARDRAQDKPDAAKDSKTDFRPEAWNADRLGVKPEGNSTVAVNGSEQLPKLTINQENPSHNSPEVHLAHGGKPDPKNTGTEANQFLLSSADQTINQSIYALPRWAHLPKPTPDVGCVSSFSNRYREAMRLAGVLDNSNDHKFRNYYQVNMTDLNKSMGSDKLLKPINDADMKEGDVIEAVDPDTTHRHMGIVGRVENGRRMVYDNYGGTWRKEAMDDRFSTYKERHYYRAFLPAKSS